MKRLFLLLIALPALVLLLIGCSDSDSMKPDPDDQVIGVVGPDLPRDTSPDVPPGNLETLVAGNHALAVDLYHELRDSEDGNLLFSPTSMRIAFAMVHAGAKGETATQISETLNFGLAAEDVPPAFNALDLALLSRNIPASDTEDPVELLPANSFWGRQGFPFKTEFLAVLATDFGAGMHVADFQNFPEESRLAINEWVEERTRERIADLLPGGSITDMTIATLVNALYLKAPWVKALDPASTTAEDFTLIDDSVIQTPTMHGTMSGGLVEGENFVAAELYLRGEDLSLVIIMPDKDRFAAFENDLDADQLSTILGDLQPTMMDVSLPQFTFRSKFKLNEAMQRLGMILPFSGLADFTGIADASLFISGAYHQAFIAVDEKGVEAAAATAIVVDLTSINRQLVVDQPFLFGIRDRPTGALLFLGRVMDPSS